MVAFELKEECDNRNLPSYWQVPKYWRQIRLDE